MTTDWTRRVVVLLIGFPMTTISLFGLIRFLSALAKDPELFSSAVSSLTLGSLFSLSLLAGAFLWERGSNE